MARTIGPSSNGDFTFFSKVKITCFHIPYLSIFWALSFCFGMFSASYFTLALWDKWDSSPVYMSVETTSLAVPNIPFPAVSICSVNKLVGSRLEKSLDSIGSIEGIMEK